MKAVKFLAAYVVAVSSIALVGLGSHAFATDASSGTVPLEFSPVCADAGAGKAHWTVTNKNKTGVEYTWTSLDQTGKARDSYTVIAPAATDTGATVSDLETTFYPNDNNQTAFATTGSTDGAVITNAASSACNTNVTVPAAPAPQPAAPVSDAPATCIDASDASNLRVIWKGDSQITITTKLPLPVCKAVTLNYSTYRMPDSYDGNGFNSTAYPQIHLSNYQFTIEAGSYGAWIMNVPTPDYCYNVQADVYYAPHIDGINGQGQGYGDDGTVLQQSGHGTQNIQSQMFVRDQSQCAPGRGQGGSASTPPQAPVTPQTLTTSTPAILPNTGSADVTDNMLSSLISLVLGAMGASYMGVRALRK